MAKQQQPVPEDNPNLIDVGDLDYETNTNPVQVPVDDGVVTFPDIFDQPAEDAEAFLGEVYAALDTARITPALRKWLSEDDYDRLAKAFPSYRSRLSVVHRVMQRYEAQWGDPGEDDASAN